MDHYSLCAEDLEAIFLKNKKEKKEMDFELKKRILEEGMRNIAETEGVGVGMDFDDRARQISVVFTVKPKYSIACVGVTYKCSYDQLAYEVDDVFKTIENTRKNVQNTKHLNPVSEYIKADIEQTKELFNSVYGINKARNDKTLPAIEKVIFNDPATIIFWKDGTKTVVKCGDNDIYDAEKGMAMAIAKKALGNKGNYCNEFKKWVEPYWAEPDFAVSLSDVIRNAADSIHRFAERLGVVEEKTDESESLKSVEIAKKIGEGFINGVTDEVCADTMILDILENDVGIDVSEVKVILCANCRYRELLGTSKPCCDCDGDYSEFKPKEDAKG